MASDSVDIVIGASHIVRLWTVVDIVIGASHIVRWKAAVDMLHMAG